METNEKSIEKFVKRPLQIVTDWIVGNFSQEASKLIQE